jgi:hypothetical protein
MGFIMPNDMIYSNVLHKQSAKSQNAKQFVHVLIDKWGALWCSG